MSTQSLPAASLRTGNRLPADRMLLWVSKYLIWKILSSICSSICGAAPIFLPVLREAPGRGSARSDDRYSPVAQGRSCGRWPRPARPTQASRAGLRPDPAHRESALDERYKNLHLLISAAARLVAFITAPTEPRGTVKFSFRSRRPKGGISSTAISKGTIPCRTSKCSAR